MRMNSEFSVLLTTGVIFAFTQHTLSYRAQLPLHGFSSFADYFQLFCLGWVFFSFVFMWEICKTALQK